MKIASTTNTLRSETSRTQAIKRCRRFYLLLSLLSPGLSHADVQLTFVPNTVDLQVGQSQLVEVHATSVPASGLAAFQYSLNFDPAIADIVDPNSASAADAFIPPSWFLTSTGRSVGVELADTAVPGALDFAYATSGTQAPPSGAGTVSLLKVVATAAGAYTVGVNNIVFANNQNPPQRFSFSAGTLDISVVSIVDTDGDGLADTLELLLGTDINLSDTDGDGLSDFEEVNFDGDPSSFDPANEPDPLNPDTDGDGLLDGEDPSPLTPEPPQQIPLLPFWAQLVLIMLIVTGLIRRMIKNAQQ